MTRADSVPVPSDPAPPRLQIVFVIATMGPGGAERQIVEILKRLDRTRFEPLLYLDERTGELLPDVPDDVPVIAFRDGPRRHALPLRWLEFLRSTPVARTAHQFAFFRRIRPDLIYDRTLVASLQTAIPAWLCGIPRVSCVVVDPEPEVKFWFRRVPRLGFRFARWAYATAAVVVCNAEHLRQRVRDYFALPPSQVTMVPNVINLDRIAATSPPRRNPGEPAELITVGRLHPQKGHRYLLEAMDELVHQRGRHVRLTIVGRGALEAELRSLVIMRQLSDHVRFAGYLPNPTELVAAADLFVLPSLFEGLPNALIEAVACGTPVVATDCPTGPREVLDNGRFGVLVPPGDSQGLADGIDAFLNDPASFRDRTSAARDYVLQRYDATASVRQLEQVLLSVAHR